MKIFLAIVILICSYIFPQEPDSTFIDSAKTFNDTSFISQDSLIYGTTRVVKDSLVKVDTLYPLNQNPLFDESFFIKRETIDKLDYRYTGDLFAPAAFTFLKDKGMIGQPNELILYGNGLGRIGFFSDGVFYNNRATGFLDLNLIQSELIDSIEILPLPRGFLYGPSYYTTAVNFVEKDFVTPVPYTRIKYYEGPEGEAFVDGIFNTSFLNKFNLFFDITNRNFDGIYNNSDFSIWQANFKLKYFLSNSINLIGSYSLVSSDLGYFGGVDVDSISRITSDINSVFYAPLEAPVVYPALRQESNWDKLKIRGLGKFGRFNTDLNFYYFTNREKYSGFPSNDEIKSYTLGTSLGQSYTSTGFKIELDGVVERRELKHFLTDTITGFRVVTYEYDVISISPIVSFWFFDSTLVPSAFFKFSSIADNFESGGGYDLTLKLSDIFNLYLGIGGFSYGYNLDGTSTYEIGTKINHNKIKADIRLYRRVDDYPDYTIIYPSALPIYSPEIQSGSLNGIAVSINYNFGKFLLEERFNYNSFEENSQAATSEINMYNHSGIFYKDILFNRNLDLKTGFVLKYYDFESDNYESVFQVDFTLSGIIQKVAIVYFSWENLFNEQYFIVPYYPMRERGIRFGLAWELFN